MNYLSEEQRRNRTKLGIPEGAVRFWATTASLVTYIAYTMRVAPKSPQPNVNIIALQPLSRKWKEKENDDGSDS